MTTKSPIRRRLGAVVTALTISAVAVSAANQATAAPTNGDIYFYAGFSNPAKAMTSSGASTTVAAHITGVPTASADGTLITWIQRSGSGGSSTYTLFTSNPDGSNKKTILTTTTGISKPIFTYDKSKILFIGLGSPKMYSADANTENQSLSAGNELLTSPGGAIMDHAISKNDKIAYITTSGGVTGCTGYGVMTRDLSGSGGGTLAAGSCSTASSSHAKYSNVVTWTPDGSKMIVGQHIMTIPSDYRIVFMDTSGTETPIATVSDNPSAVFVSPDGTKAGYTTLAISGMSATAKFYTMNIDGTGSTLIATTTDGPNFVSWMPPLTAAAATTTTATPATTTTVARASTGTPTPGVTVTDPKVYEAAPAKVADGSSISVLTAAQAATQSLRSNTPAVCLPTDEDIVFIDSGKCSVSVLDKKSGEVLRRIRTTVVSDDVSEIGIGNEVATIAPIYFANGSSALTAAAKKRIAGLKERISAAGTVMVVGHSGIMLGDTAENRALSKARAVSTVTALKKSGATGPFFSVGVGAADPVNSSTDRDAQAKNRRVIIVLVP